MDGKSDVLPVVSIVALIAALLIVVAVNKPVVNVPPLSPVVNVYGDNSTKCIKSSYNTDLSVSGNAEVKVDPDQAVIYLDVNTEGKTAKEARDKNREMSDKVIAALREYGVRGADIETSQYYLRKKTGEYDATLGKYAESSDYELTHTLKVTVEGVKNVTINVDNVGELVDVAVDAGANGVNMVTFGLTKKTETQLRDQLLVNATLDAKKKAASMAESIGVNLGKVVGIQEIYYYSPSYDYYQGSTPRYDNGMAVNVYTSIAPQKIEVTSNVNMAFEIS